MNIKICGIADAAAAAAAARAGADAVGFVFADSPRRVTPAEARRIVADLPPNVERIAVFRLAPIDEVRRVLDEFPADRVQIEPDPRLTPAAIGAEMLRVLHDDEKLDEQAARLDPRQPVLFEAAGRGGRGVRPDWDRAADLARVRPVVLAGGLHPGNVAEAVRRVRPWGVDVSSGVESSPGVKSAARIAEFVRAVRACGVRDAAPPVTAESAS